LLEINFKRNKTFVEKYCLKFKKKIKKIRKIEKNWLKEN